MQVWINPGDIGEIVSEVGITSNTSQGSDGGSTFHVFDTYTRRLNFIDADNNRLFFSEIIDDKIHIG